jgi:predicted MFS family arabinose efflux permease
MLTGLSAGTLSTCALSYAADHYPYEQRGRAMGVLSMAYFAAFVVGVPLGALFAARWGWHSVFAGITMTASIALLLVLTALPEDPRRSAAPYSLNSLSAHFSKTDRFAGIVVAFLTSGGIVGFLTYVGAWLANEHSLGIERVGILFMASGFAAVVASPIAGWLADHLGKRTVIIGANLALALMFVVVARLNWGVGLILAIAALSIAASARQGPLHALTTELVGSEIRGEYIAVRNAASQLGIAAVATLSSASFDAGGFAAVSYLAAFTTLLIPISCLWLQEPGS